MKFDFISLPPIEELTEDEDEDTVTFSCKPLHNLIKLFCLYLGEYYLLQRLAGKKKEFHVMNEHRYSHSEKFLAMFDKALTEDGWIKNDTVGENFPSIKDYNDNEDEDTEGSSSSDSNLDSDNQEADIVQQQPIFPPPEPILKRATRASSRLAKHALPSPPSILLLAFIPPGRIATHFSTRLVAK
ncbi:hypothetical protein C8Q75DRAFT_812235 [Abortiporus biennis]|nr:hypothetical protein C8Q75DRAFT_812235 [Abortiporus biennis]